MASRERSSTDPHSFARLLAEASRDLNSSLKLDDVFQRVAKRVSEVMDYHLFCVMLWNEETELLEHSFSLCLGERVKQDGGFPLGHGVSGVAAQTRRPVRLADVADDSRYVRFRHPDIEVRSELAVPLIFKDRLIGVLDLESTEYDSYDSDHEALLVALASHIATALENARLYERLLADERRLEEDIATAREVQHGLLPAEPPKVRGLTIGVASESARELGGDFYDFLPYGGGRTAIAVGDVAGKGTPAALYGAMSIGILRGYGFQHRCGPGEMLRYMNQRLNLPRTGPRFLAMVFAVFDELDATLTLSNAGVPWPYLLRNGKIDKLPVAGMPLGLLDEFEYDEWSQQLLAGDVVVMCSDGISEAMDRSHDMFGDARSREVICANARYSARDIAAALMDAVAKHSGGLHCLSDDCTIVVLKAAGADQR